MEIVLTFQNKKPLKIKVSNNSVVAEIIPFVEDDLDFDFDNLKFVHMGKTLNFDQELADLDYKSCPIICVCNGEVIEEEEIDEKPNIQQQLEILFAQYPELRDLYMNDREQFFEILGAMFA